LNFSSILNNIYLQVQPLLGQGKTASYIPALRDVHPEQFSMAVTLNNGDFFGVGDYQKGFSIQSISKVFAFTLALRLFETEIYQRVWREPSGDPFNSLVLLEHEKGIPRNPFINAGAIVVCDSLISYISKKYHSIADAGAEPKLTTFNTMLQFIQNSAADNSIGFDQQIFESEMKHGFGNLALANLMKSFGNIENDVNAVLQTYFQQCSVVMNVKQLSRSMLYLANKGMDPITGQIIISKKHTKRINSLMLTCGHYDASGDFAFNVGLPGKSGVGGGIAAIVPNKLAVAVYSPTLNKNGNSLIGTKALELFSEYTGYSIF
jgi:glutaminase